MDDWTEVETRLAEIDEYEAWRATVAAIRRLIAAIRGDPRFVDLSPSLSHNALVFRRRAPRSVLASWNEQDDTYGVAFVEGTFDVKDRRRVDQARVLDVLLEYLAQAPPAG